MKHPILQFGTGRFLQAHVDLFLAEALREGHALGKVTVVQSTHISQSNVRAAALANGYPVVVRGVQNAQQVDYVVTVDSVQAVWHADRQWALLREAMSSSVQVIVSNTADTGYLLDDRDTSAVLDSPNIAPRSYPAKLVALLFHRWQHLPAAPLSIFPCELVTRNGDTLRSIVSALAWQWTQDAAFRRFIETHCIWVNSLVDRIVSSPLEPAGAVTEPYALWAIEEQAGMVLPFTHSALAITSDLSPFELRKLWLLNLGHTFLADRWLALHRPADQTVLQAMNDPDLRAALESVWSDEVLPVFDADGSGQAARDYLVELRERFLNPFLDHKLADIAKNHNEKRERRIRPVVQRAIELNLNIAQPQLRKALGE